MELTEEEEESLLDYIFDPENKPNFLKKNAKRKRAFEDSAIFLSRNSNHKRRHGADDVKAFCYDLICTRARVMPPRLSDFFRVGRDYIWTREEGRKIVEECEGPRRLQLEPDKSAMPPLAASEPVMGRRIRNLSERPISKRKSRAGTGNQSQRSAHVISGDRFDPSSVPEEQENSIVLPGTWNHLVYKHQHMGGADIQTKFADLDQQILIAAKTLSLRTDSKALATNIDHYGPDDFRLLESIPIAKIMRAGDQGAHFRIARALIGSSLLQWVFEDSFPDIEMYAQPFRNAVEGVWSIKCEQHNVRMPDALSVVLKDAYYSQTTQPNFCNVTLPKRCRELAARVGSLLRTVFEIKVPRCLIDHDVQEAQGRYCDSWLCQVQAIFFDALNLSVKLRQREYDSFFRWPLIGEEFDEMFMRQVDGAIASKQPNLVVNITYMPAVIDLRDSENPSAVSGGVRYKALVGLGSAVEVGQEPAAISALNEEREFQ